MVPPPRLRRREDLTSAPPPKPASPLKPHLYRRRAALTFAVIDRLDIVAVGVEQERGVIARMIGPLARRAIVAAARRQPGLVKGIDRRAIRRLKGQVMPPGQLAQRRFAVLGRHEQFAIPEIIAKLAAERNRSEEHTSELQSLMRTSYAVFCLKKTQMTAHINTKQKHLHTN